MLGSNGKQQLFDVFPPLQMMYRLAHCPLFGKGRQDARSAGTIVNSHVVQKVTIKTFAAALSRAWPHLTVKADGTLKNPPQTAPGWLVKVNNGIRPRHPDRESSGEVTVHDPAFAYGQLGDGIGPIGRFWFLPSGAEVFLIEVNDGQTGPLLKPPGKGGFSGAGAADDEDALHLL